MSNRVYIGKIKSDKFDYYKEYGLFERSPLAERISKEVFNFVLSDEIRSAPLKNLPNAKNAGYEQYVMKFTKDELIQYLSNPIFKQCPACFPYVNKELYEKNSSEAIDYLLKVAAELPNTEEYLLVAYESTSLEEWELEELDG